MSPIQIHQTALIGQPLRPLQGFRTSSRNPDDKVVKHEGNLYVGPYSVIGEGVDLGNNVIIDSCCVLERGVSIGSNTLVVHRATIGGYSSVGRDCVIGGFVGEGTVIGNNCRIFGTLAHKQDDPAQSWDHREQDEPSVRVYDWTFIGFHAFVAGDIEIGPMAYITACASVTRTVPPRFVAYGHNQLCHIDDWTGDLAKSTFFEGRGLA